MSYYCNQVWLINCIIYPQLLILLKFYTGAVDQRLTVALSHRLCKDRAGVIIPLPKLSCSNFKVTLNLPLPMTSFTVPSNMSSMLALLRLFLSLLAGGARNKSWSGGVACSGVLQRSGLPASGGRGLPASCGRGLPASGGGGLLSWRGGGSGGGAAASMAACSSTSEIARSAPTAPLVAPSSSSTRAPSCDYILLQRLSVSTMITCTDRRTLWHRKSCKKKRDIE